MKEITRKARDLRNNMTNQERILWAYLRKRAIFGLKFRRQYPIENYIVDFICNEKKLIVEIDGGQHNDKNHIEYDKKRTEFLESKGYRVLRFWNSEIDNNLEGVYKTILKSLDLL